VPVLDYSGILILLVLGLLTGVGAVLVTTLLGSKRYYPKKTNPYECGIPSEGAENTRFSVKFYLVAVSFLLFDIETVFLVPWALSFQKFRHQGDGPYLFVVGAVFLFVLTIGLVYEWRKGLLEWNR